MNSAADHGLPARYVNVNVVAHGGMGTVLRAHDSQLDRPVALKVLRDGAGGEPPATLRARFEREARVIAGLSTHPSIVTVYDIGDTAEGLPFMTMQWLGGGSLPVDEHVPRGEALGWIEQCAAALDAAHVAGVVHRDVKPANILLDDARRAHVGDFGIALLQDAAAAALTSTGAVIGTVTYMSPEQAKGLPAVPGSDQYALATIAFELLTGRRPFEREGAVAELAAHVAEAPPLPSSFRPDLGPAVDHVFERALAKDPAARFPTCMAFADALRGACNRPVASPQPAHAAAPASASAAPVRTGHVRRSRGGVLLAAVALLAVGAGGIALATAGGDDDDSGGDGGGASTTRSTPQRTATEPDDRATTTRTEPEETTPAETTPEEPAEEPASPPAEEQAPPDAEQAPTVDEARALQSSSFELLNQGRFDDAVTAGQAALAGLSGVSPDEAYANFNVGAALVGLGRCDEALPYLDRSEALQGQRDEIDAARAACTGGGGGGDRREEGKPDKDDRRGNGADRRNERRDD